MGKGGQNIVQQQKQLLSSSTKYKLSGLADEELRKIATSYGLTDVKDNRDDLLAALNPYADGILDKDRPANFPLDKIEFNKFIEIQKAIPKHCFERNTLHSMMYLFSDLAQIATLFYLSTYIGTSVLPSWSQYILWPMYWYAQGAVMTGVWVLAHECGHESFSPHDLVNNTIGTIFHSLLLVPYHSWRITHRRHHGNTGSCADDEVFAPATRSDWANTMLREAPSVNAFGIIVMLTVGWMPGYLIFNATGPSKYKGKNANHFSPNAVFFEDKERPLIYQSVIAWFMALALLIYCCYTYSFGAVAFYYLIPLAITNYHLVLITYLQHTDVFVPHFRGKEFNWFRGALCTIDRSFGPLLDHTFHHITDTHVMHHLFSKMPFYHAQEATEVAKKILGPYYLKDETPIGRALYRSYSTCQFIEDDGDIVFYKNVK